MAAPTGSSRPLHITWQGLVAIILAVGLSTTLVLFGVMELLRDGHVTPEEATVLSTVLGAVVGAIATYLGGHDATRRRDDQ